MMLELAIMTWWLGEGHVCGSLLNANKNGSRIADENGPGLVTGPDPTISVVLGVVCDDGKYLLLYSSNEDFIIISV